jgi:alpha-galactosidase
MTRPKIAFIGAGSTVFARNLLRDLFTFPELRGSTIALMDIDPGRLADTEAVARQLAAAAGASPSIAATTDLRRALDGADYAVNMIQVGGYKPATVDRLRGPEAVRAAADDRRHPRHRRHHARPADHPGDGGDGAPDGGALPGRPLPQLHQPDGDALHGDGAGDERPHRRPLPQRPGHRRRPRGVARRPGRGGRLPLRRDQPRRLLPALERGGEDLYPALRRLAESGDYPAWEKVRFELFRRFGYFVTESSEHFAEYVPWFIKADRPDLIGRYNVPLDEYPARCEDQIAEWGEFREALTAADPDALPRYQAARAGQLHGMTERRLAMVAKEDPTKADRLRQAELAAEAEHAGGHSASTAR